MLSELIKQLQSIYEKHGDMPIIAGHLDEGVEQSWDDEIPYEFFRCFTEVSPAVTNLVTEDYKTEAGTARSVRSVDVPDENEIYTLSTDIVESLPYSIRKTIHNQQKRKAICLHLKGNTLNVKECQK